MTDEKLNAEIALLWRVLRAGGELLTDAPSRKIGMPYAKPYEGVCFPVQDGNEFVIVSIDIKDVVKFAVALIQQIEKARELDQKLDAEIAAAMACEAA
mgnify:CR=1 FL=1